MLEAKLAEIQSKAGKAEDKWEARVREYENRLRVAGEKIKTEKQGGKERALQLEGQVRWVFCFFFSLSSFPMNFPASSSMQLSRLDISHLPEPGAGCVRNANKQGA